TRAKTPAELLLAATRRRRGPDRAGGRACGRCRPGEVRVVDREGAVFEVSNLAPAHVGEIRVDVTLVRDADEHGLAAGGRRGDASVPDEPAGNVAVDLQVLGHDRMRRRVEPMDATRDVAAVGLA